MSAAAAPELPEEKGRGRRGAREKRGKGEERPLEGDGKRLNCVPVMCTKKLRFDQTWMASLQICTAN